MKYIAVVYDSTRQFEELARDLNTTWVSMSNKELHTVDTKYYGVHTTYMERVRGMRLNGFVILCSPTASTRQQINDIIIPALVRS